MKLSVLKNLWTSLCHICHWKNRKEKMLLIMIDIMFLRYIRIYVPALQ